MSVKLEDMKYLPDMPSDVKVRKIVIIGAGEIVKDSHLPAYKIAGYCVAAIYNRTVSKAQELADAFGIEKVFGDLDELIAYGESMNAVYDIALPADKTADVLRKLPVGSATLMQKPMGESIEEAKEILTICKERNLLAGVNFQLREAPYFVQLRKLIEEGLIGEIYDVDWKVVTLQPWSLWTWLEKKERCEINYHSIHYIDAIRSICGDPKSVYCKTLYSPKSPKLKQTRSTIIMDYGDKLSVTISTNHGHDYAPDHQESYLQIEGTKGAIRLTLGLILSYPEGRPDKLEYITYDDKEWKELPLVGSWFPEAFIGSMGGLLKKIEDPDFHYLNSVEDAYNTMCVVEACYQSSESGGTPVSYGE